METYALAFAVVSPPILLAVFYALHARIEAAETALREPGAPTDYSEQFEAIEKRLDAHASVLNARGELLEDLEGRLRDQTVAIAEGIERVDRSERRVRATVARARKRMEELGHVDEGLEAENSELRPLDADGGEEEGVPPLREGVGSRAPGFEGITTDLSAFPGRWD